MVTGDPPPSFLRVRAFYSAVPGVEVVYVGMRAYINHKLERTSIPSYIFLPRVSNFHQKSQVLLVPTRTQYSFLITMNDSEGACSIFFVVQSSENDLTIYQSKSCIHFQNPSPPSSNKQRKPVTLTRRSLLIARHWNFARTQSDTSPWLGLQTISVAVTIS